MQTGGGWSIPWALEEGWEMERLEKSSMAFFMGLSLISSPNKAQEKYHLYSPKKNFLFHCKI
jgi:hypothetical protein